MISDTRRILLRRLAVLAAGAAFPPISAASAPALPRAASCERPEVIRFSMIPVGDVEAHVRHYQPLLRRIEALTGRPVTVVRPSSYASVVEGLLGGVIDVAKLGPATYVAARAADPRLSPFATIEKHPGRFQSAGAFYQSLLVTLDDGRYSGVAAVKGRRLALIDPGSTSGALVPRREFAPGVGMPLERYFASISFTGSHAKAIAALRDGEVDAAFLASTQLEEAHRAGTLPAVGVRVLWTSAPLPFDPFVFRSGLCESLRRQIRDAFLGAGAERELRTMLDEFFHARRFVPAGDIDYNGIRALVAGER